MHTYTFEGVVTALTSITHNGGDSFGISTKLRRERFVQPDGSVEEVPTISGNGVRGVLRDRGMQHMCKALGYGVEKDGHVSGLSLAAFYFLFSGGSLTSTATDGLDIDKARELAKTIPLVGVFGGAVGNMILPGKLKCGKLIPICAETAHLLPDVYRETARTSVWDYVQEEMFTRRDDEKDEHLRRALAPESRLLLDNPASRRTALAEGRGEAAQQMMYYVETLPAGTRFFWKITLDDVTDIEYEAFLTTLAEFSRRPYLGGKSGTGMGEVAVSFDKWLRIDSRLAPQGEAVDLPLGHAYVRHLTASGPSIRKILEEFA
jgi:hypothetical protein